MAAGETDKALGLKIFEHPGHNLPGTAKMVCNLLMGQCQVIGFFQGGFLNEKCSQAGKIEVDQARPSD